MGRREEPKQTPVEGELFDDDGRSKYLGLSGTTEVSQSSPK